MQPAHFVAMDQFPLNLHGKVDRRALPPPVDLLYLDAPYVAPSTEIESSLGALWGEVLELPKVGVTHSFVDLGGDSLKAIRVLSRVYQTFGVETKLQELFPGGTVRGLARTLTARGAGNNPVAEPELVTAGTQEDRSQQQSGKAGARP